MEHSSTRNFKDRQKELVWFYTQPGFRLIRGKQAFFALLWIIVIVGVIGMIWPALIFESVWIVVVLPLVAAVVVLTLLELQPHRQIYYRIDPFSVYSEFRSTSSPLSAMADLIVAVVRSWFSKKDRTSYLTRHYSRSREFEWKEIVSVEENKSWRTIVLRAGLRGQMILWTNADNHTEVLTLVNEYVNKARKTYD